MIASSVRRRIEDTCVTDDQCSMLKPPACEIVSRQIEKSFCEERLEPCRLGSEDPTHAALGLALVKWFHLRQTHTVCGADTYSLRPSHQTYIYIA